MAGQPLEPKLPHGNQPKPSNLSESPKSWMNEREPLSSRGAIPRALPIRRGAAWWMENEDKWPPVMRPSSSGGSPGVDGFHEPLVGAIVPHNRGLKSVGCARRQDSM
jgi:hypothetical protein